MSYKNRLNKKSKVPEVLADPVDNHRTVRVDDVMVSPVYTTSRHATLGELRKLMAAKNIQCVPVVDDEQHPVGIVTTRDLLEGMDERTQVGKVMIKKVYTVPQYAPVQDAARVMRKHSMHHVVVTHEKAVVGIVSTFDVLRLVEDKRFVPRNLSDNAGKAKTRKAAKLDSE